jgi:hypothetical protein
MRAGETRKTWLGGILLAIALFTRPEGFVMVIAVLIALVLGRVLTASGKFKALPVLVPPLVVGGAWFIFLRLNPTPLGQAYDLYGDAMRGILAGQIHWSAFYTIFRFIVGQAVRFRDWGLLPALVGLMLVLGLRLRTIRHDLATAALTIALLTMGLAIIGLHYMAAYVPGDPDFVYTWLSLEFTRVAMPAVLCFLLLGFLSVKDLF